MKKAKFISIVVTILIGIVFLSSFGINLNLNKTAKSLDSKGYSQVYWFPARVKVEDRDLKYIIVSTSRIRHGHKNLFDKEIWRYLTKRVVIIGPFQTLSQATMARSLYKDSEDKIKFLPDTGMPTTIYWFNIHFVQSPRLKIYVINRIPASVSLGSLKDFRDAFYIQLQQQSLPVGPFYMKENAEEAKRIYRQNE